MAIRHVSLLLAALITLGLVATANAQDGSLRRKINKGTVGLIAGANDDTNLSFATDMASVLDSEDVRVLAMAGKGSLQNIEDLLYLRGVDIGLVQADALAFVQRDGLYTNIEKRVHYISHLYDETLHLVVGRNIASITDLTGKKVALGPPGSKHDITGRNVFGALGINVVASPLTGGFALDLVKQGKLAAAFIVADKGAPMFRNLAREDGVKFLPLQIDDSLRRTYQPALLTSETYPRLIAQNSVVESLSVGTVLAVYNWEPNSVRYNKVSRFVEAFFGGLQTLKDGPRHPKWREARPGQAVPGWNRFRPAEDWIITETAGETGDIKQAFESFVESQAPSIANRLGSDRDKEELFRLFLLWQASQRQQ